MISKSASTPPGKTITSRGKSIPRYRGLRTRSESTSLDRRDAGTMTPRRRYDPAHPSSDATTGVPLSANSVASRLRAENSAYLRQPSMISSASSHMTVVTSLPPSGSTSPTQRPRWT